MLSISTNDAILNIAEFAQTGDFCEIFFKRKCLSESWNGTFKVKLFTELPTFNFNSFRDLSFEQTLKKEVSIKTK